MTSRERILAALRRQAVDYVPCCVAFNPLEPVTRKGHAWQFPWPFDAPLAERLAYAVEKLGLDQVVDVSIALLHPDPVIKSKTWLEGAVLHKVFQTPAGDLTAAINYNELWPHGMDIPFISDFNIGHFVKPWIANEADLECFRRLVRMPELNELRTRILPALTQGRALADKYRLATIAHIGLGLTGAQHLFGAESLCLMTIENPGLVDAYLEYEHRLNLRAIEVFGELGVDIVRRNGFYETADFYGPEMLERFVGKRIRREADAARSAGILTSYTVHTGIMPILDYLARLTVDSYFGIDIAFHGVDLARAHKTLSPNKSFWIGPSSTYHLWKGPDATREAVRKVFATVGKAGLIIAPCVSAHSIMPWESTLAMIDEWKRLRQIKGS